MSAAVASEMTCKEFVELVTDYFEDRLTTEESTRLELHVCTCTGCRVYLAQMRAVVRTTRRLSGRDLPAAGREQLLPMFREWKRR